MRKFSIHRRNGFLLTVLAVSAALALAGCGGGSKGDGSSPIAGTGPPPAASTSSSKEARLVDVVSVDELRALFNKDAGRPRLLLLLSPT